MFEIAITILGAAAAGLYIGYLAYSIKAIPLWVIVVLAFALMIREFVRDLMENADRARRNDNNR